MWPIKNVFTCFLSSGFSLVLQSSVTVSYNHYSRKHSILNSHWLLPIEQCLFLPSYFSKDYPYFSKDYPHRGLTVSQRCGEIIRSRRINIRSIGIY